MVVLSKFDFGVGLTLSMTSIHFQESLGSTRKRLMNQPCSKLCALILLRIVMNIFVLALMASSIWLIIYVSEKETKVGAL